MSHPLSRCLLSESALSVEGEIIEPNLRTRQPRSWTLPAKFFLTKWTGMHDGHCGVLGFVMSFAIMRSRERLATLLARKAFAWGRWSRSRRRTSGYRSCAWSPINCEGGEMRVCTRGRKDMWWGWVIKWRRRIRLLMNRRWLRSLVGVARITMGHFRWRRNKLRLCVHCMAPLLWGRNILRWILMALILRSIQWQRHGRGWVSVALWTVAA